MNWIKIDSAPKDGEDILCFCKATSDYQIVCHWSEYEDDGTSWCTHNFGREKGWNDYQCETHNPSYWMPLPKPPEDK